MPKKLLDDFHQTAEALQNAIGAADEDKISLLDQQIQSLFDEILKVEPDTPICRNQLIRFLLDHCSNNSGTDGLVQAAKNRIMELI